MITEKYIKMCDTPEIQDNWEHEYGDWYIDKKCYGVRGEGLPAINTKELTTKLSEEYKKSMLGSYIWLPFQHQLQEMVIRDIIPKGRMGAVELHYYCSSFAQWLEETKDIFMCSVEEYALAFTMHSLYQKKWNNTKEVWE